MKIKFFQAYLEKRLDKKEIAEIEQQAELEVNRLKTSPINLKSLVNQKKLK